MPPRRVVTPLTDVRLQTLPTITMQNLALLGRALSAVQFPRTTTGHMSSAGSEWQGPRSGVRVAISSPLHLSHPCCAQHFACKRMVHAQPRNCTLLSAIDSLAYWV